MNSKTLTLSEYADFCAVADVGASYSAEAIAYYYSALDRSPKIVGRYDRDGRLVAAFPVLYGQLFPNSLHKRMLPRTFPRLGDIGQPEALFPVRAGSRPIALWHLSPVTSPLLRGTVRSAWRAPLKQLIVGKQAEHKRDTRKLRAFLAARGAIVPSESLNSQEFADIYLRLHCARWKYDPGAYGRVREQIVALYGQLYGIVLLDGGEPVAAHFCLKNVGPRTLHIESINIGVKPHASDQPSYGSILLLASLRRAEALAASLGRSLRCNYGYCYGASDYKLRWGDAVESFVAF